MSEEYGFMLLSELENGIVSARSQNNDFFSCIIGPDGEDWKDAGEMCAEIVADLNLEDLPA